MSLPKRSRWMLRWFTGYARRYTARHFHAVRRSRSSYPVPQDGQPLLFVLNHPSWWDLLMLFVAVRTFPSYRHYAPIDASMLHRYRMFARLGLFPIESTPGGALAFMRTAEAIFAEPFGAMWLTAQGRFADVRERPLNLRPGIGALASRLQHGFVIPAAMEYTFWDERMPEALVRFGEPLDLSESLAPSEWTARVEDALTETMDLLAAESMRRDPALFDTLVAGRVGVGGPYDLWRRTRAAFTGRKAQLAHRVEPEAVLR